MLNYKDIELNEFKFVSPYWDTYEKAYEMFDYMKENKLSVFSEEYELEYGEADIDDLTIHDYQKGKVSFPGGWNWSHDYKILKIDSWAADMVNNMAYSEIIIKINDKYYKTEDNISRQDVVDFFNNQEFKDSGFKFSKNTENLNEGINSLQVLLVSGNYEDSYLSDNVYIYKNQDGSLYMCN